ncbi:MAG: 16S rRNA (guanine(527)-N(7))-methyltransferase RsmG [Desulfobaccales bacterium]|nr:16S rRNA (guanine(527)-N(7))-methyltransferase RsmG [Desulfobaccales bacterium]
MRGNSPDTDPLNFLQQGAAALDLELSPPILEQFRLYLKELKLWNARVNLTGLKTDRDIIVRHFLDSLTVAPFLGPAASLADLGSGAGFPGLVLKILRPELALTLVEAREKKAAFLEYLVSYLKLTGVEVIKVHLTPSLALKWGPRFAAVVSRATFSLARFLKLAAPLLLPGGHLMALKGPHLPEEELKAAAALATRQGLGPFQLHHYRLPITGEARVLIMAPRA